MVAAVFRRAGLLCLPAVLACAAAACSGGDSERPRELEERLVRAELLLAEALADLEQEADAGKDRIAELEAELERTERQLQQASEVSLASAERDSDSSTLRAVIKRGELLCGVKLTRLLFSYLEADRSIAGFDIEFCKAIAAAVLGDPSRVQYIDASNVATRFELLQNSEIDVLVRATTITASRDGLHSVDFTTPTFYTGQGFAVRRDSGIKQIRDLDGATICVQSGATTEQNLADHFTELGLDYTPLGGTRADVFEAFFVGHCDAVTADVTVFASWISMFDDAGDFTVLGSIISKEPLALGVRDYDSEWKDVVNWVVQGLIAAEEMGITSRNVGSMASNPPNPTVARLLGVPFGGSAGATLGFDSVDAQFIQRAIRAVGNYGEIYDRTIGDTIPRACTRNALAIDDAVDCPAGQGGILYALPYQ